MGERKSREEKMSVIQKKLEAGCREIYESGKWDEYIRTMSQFPHYSINNCILIASQLPTASYVCGFKKWGDFQRKVNRGEHGLMIIAPVKVKADVEETVMDQNNCPVVGENGEQKKETVTKEFQSFRPAYVFDVSQTSGEPLPSLASQLEECVDDYEKLKQILIEISPVPVSFELFQSGANGYFSPKEQRIVIREDLPELQTVKTLIHEISHCVLGHGGKEDKWDRETKEVQAESVAYWVTQMMGLDTSEYSFGYISGWSKDKEVSELKENLDLIKNTADQLSKSIEEKLEQLAEQSEQKKAERKISHHR